MNIKQQWQDIKAGYLQAIQKKLAAVEHPRRDEVLNDVGEHLERKYSELPEEHRDWEHFQQIITEMGPPEEYAELLSEENGTIEKSGFGMNGFLAIVFGVMLILVGVFVVKNTKPALPPASNTDSLQITFEPDERIVGKWVTIDFIGQIDEFDPTKKKWQGRLFLQSLEFRSNGRVVWQAESRKPMELEWTKGKVEPLDKRPSFYYMRTIDGQPYLFYEWVSGDVTDRGREPGYYVLKQYSAEGGMIPAWFENDPRAIGYWVSVDFVKTIEEFNPQQQQTTELYLKTLQFEDNGQLWWTLGESGSIGLNWTKGTIRPFDILPASYTIKQKDQTDYLFYEYRTDDNHKAGYYVFKQTPKHEQTRKAPEPFINDPEALGTWISVDFVGAIGQFVPGQRQWRGDFFVNSLCFKQQGDVEYSFGEDQLTTTHRWTKGKLLDEELDAHYLIRELNGDDYLFMEWNSGDVTIRGQKPAYYILKKKE